MRNWAEFDIQGNIANIDVSGRAVRVDIAANYGRKNKDSGEWENTPYFNRVTFFDQAAERVKTYLPGDLVHVRGRVRQNSYEKDGVRHYTVDLIADRFGRILRKELADGADQHGDGYDTGES